LKVGSVKEKRQGGNAKEKWLKYLGGIEGRPRGEKKNAKSLEERMVKKKGRGGGFR